MLADPRESRSVSGRDHETVAFEGLFEVSATSRKVSHETKPESELPSIVEGLLPKTWVEVASNEGVAPSAVSGALATVLTEQKIDRKGVAAPRPNELDPEILALVIKEIKHVRKRYRNAGRSMSPQEEREIREAMDDAEAETGLLGRGLCEFVAKKLDLHLDIILNVMETRVRVLRFEQRVKAENEAI